MATRPINIEIHEDVSYLDAAWGSSSLESRIAA